MLNRFKFLFAFSFLILLPSLKSQVVLDKIIAIENYQEMGPQIEKDSILFSHSNTAPVLQRELIPGLDELGDMKRMNHFEIFYFYMESLDFQQANFYHQDETQTSYEPLVTYQKWYDDDGQVTKWTAFLESNGDKWEKEFQYNLSSQLTNATFKKLAIDGTWEPRDSLAISYDNFGNKIVELEVDFYQDAVVRSYRDSFVYDADHRIIEFQNLYTNADGDQNIIEFKKIKYKNGLIDSVIYFPSPSVHTHLHKVAKFHYEGDRIDYILHHAYDSSTQDYTEFKKREDFIFNPNNQLITYIIKESFLSNPTEFHYEYNDQGLLSYFDKCESTNSCAFRERTWFYYEEAPVSSKELNTLNFSISPNPAANTLHLSSLPSLTQINIYNLEGSLLMSQQGASNNIDISPLTNGIYILEVSTNGEVGREKFVKL